MAKQANPATIIDYIDSVFEKNGEVLKYFYKNLFKQYNPDINGYNLIFMMPPDLSGWNKTRGSLYSQYGTDSYVHDISKFITFGAIDFTSPTQQVNTEKISSRNGAIPYVTEVSNTDQCSITYIDNSDIDIYHFHHMWIEYMRAVVDGFVEPADKYMDPNSSNFGAIDYAASIYIVKYVPNLKDIRYISKSIGCFPQTLPSKELIGQRTSNELTTLPFTYFVAGYREATWKEENHWLIQEFKDLVKVKF